MDFKGIVTVLAATLVFSIVQGKKGSKCLDSKGNLKCAYPLFCIDKKRNLCYPPLYEGKGCKCKKPIGCRLNNFHSPGCDNGLVCMKGKDDPCSEHDYTNKKCSCAAGCWASHFVPGCDDGHVCMKRNKKGTFQTCKQSQFKNKKCACYPGCNRNLDTGCGTGQVCLDNKANECSSNKYSSKACFCVAGCMTSRNTPGCDYGKECMKENFDVCGPADYSNKACSCRIQGASGPSGCLKSQGSSGCDHGLICLQKKNGKLASGNKICTNPSDPDCACVSGCQRGQNGVPYGILSSETNLIQIPVFLCKLCKCRADPMSYLYGFDTYVDYCIDQPGCNQFAKMLQDAGKK